MDYPIVAGIAAITIATLASPIVAVWKGHGPWMVGAFIFSAIELLILVPGFGNVEALVLFIFISRYFAVVPLLLSWLCTYLAYREKIRDERAGEIE